MTTFKTLCRSVITLTVLCCASCATDNDGPHQGHASTPTNNLKIIYDGDIGPDPCDFATLSMLHEYHNRELIEIVGVIGATPDRYLASTFSVYNQLYGNDIPIGAYNDDSGDLYDEAVTTLYDSVIALTHYNDPNRVIQEKYADTQTADDVVGPVQAYRMLLSQAADDSITIYAAGQLFNLAGVLASAGDHYSTLDGAALIQEKVRDFVFMGGYFPSSFASEFHKFSDNAEWNWWALGERNTTKTTLGALAAMGKPMTYVGYEIGQEILVGNTIVQSLGSDHPTSEAYYQYRITSDGTGTKLLKNNPAFDEAALFYLVEGENSPYFGEVRGQVHIDEKGANTWLEGDGNERYITLLPGVEHELEEIITARVTGEY